jgi:CheY-like chemotaxis protein
VVDDEILIRKAVADFLRACGYRVLEASNAAEAQVVFKAGAPVEILISDVNMPGHMNGFCLAQWVRQEYPDVLAIIGVAVRAAAIRVAGSPSGARRAPRWRELPEADASIHGKRRALPVDARQRG